MESFRVGEFDGRGDHFTSLIKGFNKGQHVPKQGYRPIGLEKCIFSIFLHVSVEILDRTWKIIEYRLDIFRAARVVDTQLRKQSFKYLVRF